MKNTTANTPSPTIEELQKRCDTLEQQKTEMDAKIKWLEEQFRLSQQRRFGSSSEQSNPDQLNLFNEAEAEASPLHAEPTMETVTYKRKKKIGQRKIMLENLSTETIEYRLTEEEQICSFCSGSCALVESPRHPHPEKCSCCGFKNENLIGQKHYFCPIRFNFILHND